MTTAAELAGARYVIIGGTSKAGTTAVFDALSEHPEVCPSQVKETRFFLDQTYPLKLKPRWSWETDPNLRYSYFFDPKDQRSVRLEATPDYMYSERTARAICAELENVDFVFILREPISRLMSYYRFGHRLGLIPSGTTFDSYVERQAGHADPFPKGIMHPAFMALPHGRYSRYLERFVDVFGTSRIHVLFYEHFARQPGQFMNELCSLVRIDGSALNDSAVRTINKSVSLRSPLFHRAFWRSAQRLRHAVREWPRARAVLRAAGSPVKGLYERLNITQSKQIVLLKPTERFLREYYSRESSTVERMFGVTTPW